MAHDASLVNVSRAGEPTRPAGALELDALRRSREVYGFVTNVRQLADEGWSGNPTWADESTAEKFVDTVATDVVQLVQNALELRRSGTKHA